MFHLYSSGPAFLQENQHLLLAEPLQTAFFIGNAQNMPVIRDNIHGFAVKAEQDGRFLMAIRYLHHSMVLYGDESLCGLLAQGLGEHGLLFHQVLAQRELAERFLRRYQQLWGGRFQGLRCMKILRWGGKEPDQIPPDSSEPAQPQDFAALVDLVAQFHREALEEEPDLAELEQAMARELPNYWLLRRQGKPVSIAKKARSQQSICAVSNVYTLPAFRGQGLARQVVSGLTRQILLEDKLPYLYVDIKNPISNHLYRSLGYVEDCTQMEFSYTVGTARQP